MLGFNNSGFILPILKDKEIAELKERVKTVEKENKEIKAFICSKSRELSFCK